MNVAERKKTIGRIVLFSLLVTVVAFIGPLLGGSPASPGPGFILWGAAPLLVAVLMRLVTRDWSDAGIKPAIRKNGVWYLISIFVWPVLILLTLLFGAGISALTVSDFSVSQYLKTFLPALPVFFIFAIFEEFGWRGYLVPKLASAGINVYLASALTAVVWATWHLPYIRELTWVYSAEELITFIPRFYLVLFAFSILYHEIRILSGTFWPAVLMHCLANSVGHPLAAEYVSIAPGMDYLVSFNGLFIAALAALLGIALHQRRMSKAGVPNLSKSLT